MEIKKEVVTFEKNQVIFKQSGPADCLYIIKTGEVKIVKELNDKISIVGLVGPKDFLGEGAVLTGGTRSAHAVASQYTVATKINYGDIEKILETKPIWVRELMKALVEKLNESSKILAEHGIPPEEYQEIDSIELRKLMSTLVDEN